MDKVKRQGRIAGALYLGVVITGIFSLAYAPGQFYVRDDMAATARAVFEQRAFLLGAIACGLAMNAFFLALPFALASFLSPYGRNAARLMIVLVAASTPFMIVALYRFWQIASLASAEAPDPQTVARLFDDYKRFEGLASIFWGLWLAPLGYLVLKSGAIPRILGPLLLCGFIGYVAGYFGPRIFEGYQDLPYMKYFSPLGSVGEIGTCLWLLVMGARGPNTST